MGLQKGDLRFLVDDVFEVDSFSSKMGEDKHIVTLSFSVHEREAAKDLMNFCEKGYPFVLDADVSTGEQPDGTYKVFVEMERDKNVPNNVHDLVYGVQELSMIDSMRFRYYKGFKSNDCTVENLTASIPLDDSAYDQTIQENTLNNYTNFFNKSMVNSLYMKDNNIIVEKVYAADLRLEVVDFGDTLTTIDKIQESINLDDMSEILFLTKYLGDYNISKFGDKISLTNNDKTLIVKRI